MREYDQIGEQYSKLTEEQRNAKIKELRQKLNKVKANNINVQKDIDKLYANKRENNEFELETHIELLTHTFQIGEWVFIRERYSNENKDRIIPVKIRKRIKNKNYEIEYHAVGIKEGMTLPKIHESQIICGIKDVAYIMGDIKYYDKSYKGKVKFQNTKNKEKL